MKCGLLTIYVKQKCEKFWHFYKKWFEWVVSLVKNFQWGYQVVIWGRKNFGEYEPYLAPFYKKGGIMQKGWHNA